MYQNLCNIEHHTLGMYLKKLASCVDLQGSLINLQSCLNVLKVPWIPLLITEEQLIVPRIYDPKLTPIMTTFLLVTITILTSQTQIIPSEKVSYILPKTLYPSPQVSFHKPLRLHKVFLESPLNPAFLLPLLVLQ
jgi:hypothetical protein